MSVEIIGNMVFGGVIGVLTLIYIMWADGNQPPPGAA